MKTLKFSVCEQSGRTFEIPLEKAKEIIETYSPSTNLKNWNEDAIASELYNNYSDDLAQYEKENTYFESYVQDVEVKGE